MVRRHTLFFPASNTQSHGHAGRSLTMRASQPMFLTLPFLPPILFLGVLLHQGLAALLTVLLIVGAGILLTQNKAVRNAKGREGEVMAARFLTRVPDAQIFHDVIIGSENVDSVVLTHEGIYTIEVKHWAFAVADKSGITQRGKAQPVLQQARRQAVKLGKELQVFVTPVVVFTHPTARVFVKEHSGVAICSIAQLPATLTRLRLAQETGLSDKKYQLALQSLILMLDTGN